MDDCLYVSEYPIEALDQITHYFPMKSFSMGPPKIYLREKITKIYLLNSMSAYALNISQYVHEAVRIVEAHLRKRDLSLDKRAIMPM